MNMPTEAGKATASHVSRADLMRTVAARKEAAVAERLARLAEVLELTGLGRSTVYKLMGTGDFPASVRLGGRSVAWRLSAVIDWIDSRPATSEQPSPK